ncbi:NUDIX hydrolase [Spirosoma sp. KUDC1026]|uniref:NUDIX hydrolase n=1 Tax=Spirosoma sp. KUDC1026 TaxID=2745947 RepID=UPI00159BAE00|nr:NUDIX domain-containing protein [Spirosoma sp. KUDC1026]QKZ13276.1 NUDIX hydrolase [Spirosoma sp. KUDC1026]
MLRQNDPREISPQGDGLLKGIAVDPVIFGFHENQLKVLIIEHTNTGLYALPGGYIQEAEDLDEAAKRILTMRTGLGDVYLEQFHVFGKHNRTDPEVVKEILLGQGFTPSEDHWSLKRFISVGYYALVDYTKTKLTTDPTTGGCDWYDFDKIPPLIFDHRFIIEKALNTLRDNLDQRLIGFNLLPAIFTMGELHTLYETILGKKLLSPNFQRKMLGLGILERIEKKKTGKAHKSPYLYRFKSGGQLEQD